MKIIAVATMGDQVIAVDESAHSGVAAEARIRRASPCWNSGPYPWSSTSPPRRTPMLEHNFITDRMDPPRPRGGTTRGPGLTITWADPLRPQESEITSTTVPDVIEAARARLEWQRNNTPMGGSAIPTEHDRLNWAIGHLEQAVRALQGDNDGTTR